MCVYVYIVSIHVRLSASFFAPLHLLPPRSAHLHIFTYITHIYVFVHTHTKTHTHLIYAHTHTHIVCVCVCAYIRMYLVGLSRDVKKYFV